MQEELHSLVRHGARMLVFSRLISRGNVGKEASEPMAVHFFFFVSKGQPEWVASHMTMQLL